MVFVKRAEVGLHAGQLAFPGGNPEADDDSLAATAVREATEELGLDRSSITLVEQMTAVRARTTGYIVTPFLARIDRPRRWSPDIEVAQVVELPVDSLLDPGARQHRRMSFPTWPEPRDTPCLVVDGQVIWGLTLRILQPALERLAVEHDLDGPPAGPASPR